MENKYRGVVGSITNPAALTFGQIWRLGFASQYMTPPDERFGQITLSPTWQNFPHPAPDGSHTRGDMDGYLKQIKDKDIKIIAACWNSFNKKFATHLKGLPKDNPTLNRANPASYLIYEKILTDMVKRWGRTGSNVIWAKQPLNEVNDYPGKPDSAESLFGFEYAALLTHWRNKIREIDSDMAICTAPTARFDRVWLDSFWDTWTRMNEGVEDENFYVCMNIYPFGGCGAFGKCDAKKVEESLGLMDEVNTWLKDRNVKGMITEHGCNSTKQSDLGYPNYEGKDGEESQAELVITYTKKWLKRSHVYAAMCYQIDDDNNEPRFSKTGLCYDSPTNPQPKKSYHLVKSAFSQPFEPSEKVAKIELMDNPNIIVE